MRKQIFRNLLRSSMQDVEIPVRYEHLQKTISLAKNEWKKRVVRPRITFSKFLTTQIKFVGWKIWLAQAIVLLCLSYLLVFFGDYILNNQRNVALLLCCISILVLMSAIPFIQRSIRYKTYEIETATRFSATKGNKKYSFIFITPIFDCKQWIAIPYWTHSNRKNISKQRCDLHGIIFSFYDTRQNLSNILSTGIFSQMGSNMYRSCSVLHLSDTIYPLSFFL